MTGDTIRTVRLTISGRVQGVWYRGWTVETAGRMCLDGWVRNRRDGTVEAVVSGPPAAVEAMVAACHDGPPTAAVTHVAVAEEAELPASGFQQLPTV